MRFLGIVLLGWTLCLPCLAEEVSLNPGEGCTLRLAGGSHLRLQARIPSQAPAGAAYILEIKAGGQELGPLLNKASKFTFRDGRSFPYSGPKGAWSIFYSPDFEANNSLGSNYQVTSDKGQAYLYEWQLPGPDDEPVEVQIRNVQFREGQDITRPLVVDFLSDVTLTGRLKAEPASGRPGLVPLKLKAWSKSSQNFLKVFGPYQEADSLPPDYQNLKLAPRPIRFSIGPGPKGLAFDLAGDWRISPSVLNSYVRSDGCSVEIALAPGPGPNPATEFRKIVDLIKVGLPGMTPAEIKVGGVRGVLVRDPEGSQVLLVLFPSKQWMVRIRMAASNPEAETQLAAVLDTVLRSLRWTAPKARQPAPKRH